MARLHQNNFATNLTSNQIAGVTTTPLNDIPSIAAPFYLAFDATNLNGKYEVVDVTSKTATHVNHAATTYAHTTAEEVRMVVPAVELDSFVTSSGTTGALLINAPQGFLINGKISVTDAAGITVAIKTLAGTDPSATDPVYCRIGDTVRTISAALSVVKADGTNWFGSGAAELAAKEIDYFVYLAYRASDTSVIMLFGRLPYWSDGGGVGTVTTGEFYGALSGGANLASGDPVELIGRFAATLSAGAGYTWSVPTFTTTNLIQRPIYETRWLGWLPTYTGFSAAPTGTMKYKIAYDYLKIYFSDAGTSNSATFNFTLPLIPANFFTLIPAHVLDNGAGVDTGVLGMSIGGATSTVKVGKTQSTRAANAFAGFTTSGSKGYDGHFETPIIFL